ncbi:hypothetical protein [Hydrogenoanaerobacterium sp.]|uniref:hypothetical protein n=1 Tax=Hydrogenoanaerobacterium sp. TaxID=2953763 RepID=UPI002898805C|nr:hypothetical protein [Hydrogenoanaerobacterium sp.]
MVKERITDVVMDDASINVSKEVDLVFSIANSLRGGQVRCQRFTSIGFDVFLIFTGLCGQVG